MNPKVLLIFVLFATMLNICTTACSRENEVQMLDIPDYPNRCMIDWYTDADSIEVKFIEMQDGKPVMRLLFDGEWYGCGSEKHKFLTWINADTAYNKHGWAFTGYSALMHTLLSVDVISLDDYDAQHPKGSSLNDIVRYYFISHYDFIQGGYDPAIPTVGKCLLSEFPTDGVPMIWEPHTYMEFISKPSVAGEHKMQVIATLKNGPKLSTSMTASFESRNIVDSEKPFDATTFPRHLPRLQ
ncbi:MULTISPECIES: hypothetical protein [Bacteroidales]|uniref:hypothetical protein n=1 Tax=Bacteroidales TaxID=171549 RepID=UPI0035A13B48